MSGIVFKDDNGVKMEVESPGKGELAISIVRNLGNGFDPVIIYIDKSDVAKLIQYLQSIVENQSERSAN